MQVSFCASLGRASLGQLVEKDWAVEVRMNISVRMKGLVWPVGLSRSTCLAVLEQIDAKGSRARICKQFTTNMLTLSDLRGTAEFIVATKLHFLDAKAGFRVTMLRMAPICRTGCRTTPHSDVALKIRGLSTPKATNQTNTGQDSLAELLAPFGLVRVVKGHPILIEDLDMVDIFLV